jgi:hypothetical protein
MIHWLITRYYILHPDTIALECDYQPPQQGSARYGTLKEIMDHNLIGPYQHRLDYGGLTLQPAGERRLAVMRRERLRALIVLATEERRMELSEKTEGGIIEKFVVGVIWRQVLTAIEEFRLGSLCHIEPPRLQGLVVDAPLAPMEAVVGPANNPKRAYGRDKENQAPNRSSKTKVKARADGRQKRKTPIKQGMSVLSLDGECDVVGPWLMPPRNPCEG